MATRFLATLVGLGLVATIVVSCDSSNPERSTEQQEPQWWEPLLAFVQAGGDTQIFAANRERGLGSLGLPELASGVCPDLETLLDTPEKQQAAVSLAVPFDNLNQRPLPELVQDLGFDATCGVKRVVAFSPL